MSFQSTVDGLLNAGIEIYTSKELSKNQSEIIRDDERRKVSGEFEERFFEERQSQSNALAAQGQDLIKIGGFVLLGVTALVLVLRVKG